MSTESQPISILSETECWHLLASLTLGRLVTSVDAQPEIFPVNFVVQRRTVLFRTAEGTELVSAVVNNHVLFEADDHGVRKAGASSSKERRTRCVPMKSSTRRSVHSYFPGSRRSNRITSGFAR